MVRSQSQAAGWAKTTRSPKSGASMRAMCVDNPRHYAFKISTNPDGAQHSFSKTCRQNRGHRWRHGPCKLLGVAPRVPLQFVSSKHRHHRRCRRRRRQRCAVTPRAASPRPAADASRLLHSGSCRRRAADTPGCTTRVTITERCPRMAPVPLAQLAVGAAGHCAGMRRRADLDDRAGGAPR